MTQLGVNETKINDSIQEFNFQYDFDDQFEDCFPSIQFDLFQPHKQQMDHLFWQQADQFSWKNQFKDKIIQSHQIYTKEVTIKNQIDEERNQKESDEGENLQISLSDSELQQTTLKQQCQKQINNFFNLYLNSTQKNLQSNHLSLKQFSRQQKISYNTVFNLYQKWLNAQFQTKFYKKVKQEIQEPLREKQILNIQQFLLKTIAKNPLLTLYQVSQIANKQKDVQIQGQLGRKQLINYNKLNKLCKKLNMKKAKLFLNSSIRNLPEDYKFRKLYASKLIQLQKNKKRIVFIDQMYINQWTTRDRAWAKKGQFYPNVMINLKKESFLLVSTINQRGAVKFQIVHDGITTTKYEEVISRLSKYASKQQPGQKVLVINEAINLQNRNIMKTIGELNGFQILILPAYSSKLNPLELYFCQVRDLLKLQKYSNQKQLVNAVRKILFQQLKKKPLPNYFLISQMSLQTALNEATL